jgi:H+/Cl- antiporter ClcA
VLGAIVHRLIDGIQRFLWGSGTLLEAAGRVPDWWLIVALPAAGGLVVGLSSSPRAAAGRGRGCRF